MIKLDYKLHTSCIQVLVHCGSKEGLIYIINKFFGHLNSVLCHSECDVMGGMVNIGREKLG